MPERGSSKVVHINLLKKWHQRETAYANIIEEGPEIVDYRWKEGDTLRVREQLGTEPLTELTRTQQPEQVEWSECTERAFQRLKDTLTSVKLMRNPDFTQTFILQLVTLVIYVSV